MRRYNWNPYQKDWHQSNRYKNSRWNDSPGDENYYLGRLNDQENIDPDRRYYENGSDRYYRNDEIERNPPNKYQLKTEQPYKNNDFYGERKRNYSWGPHRGKGPKNYVRSIERIREDASDRLTEDPMIDASRIEIWIKDGELVLSGTVETRLEKRRAEYLVENINGVNHVQNNLRVDGNQQEVPKTFG